MNKCKEYPEFSIRELSWSRVICNSQIVLITKLTNCPLDKIHDVGLNYHNRKASCCKNSNSGAKRKFQPFCCRLKSRNQICKSFKILGVAHAEKYRIRKVDKVSRIRRWTFRVTEKLIDLFLAVYHHTQCN